MLYYVRRCHRIIALHYTGKCWPYFVVEVVTSFCIGRCRPFDVIKVSTLQLLVIRRETTGYLQTKELHCLAGLTHLEILTLI